MKVRILSGNQKGAVVEMPQVEAEANIATGLAEVVDPVIEVERKAAVEAQNKADAKAERAQERADQKAEDAAEENAEDRAAARRRMLHSPVTEQLIMEHYDTEIPTPVVDQLLSQESTETRGFHACKDRQNLLELIGPVDPKYQVPLAARISFDDERRREREDPSLQGIPPAVVGYTGKEKGLWMGDPESAKEADVTEFARVGEATIVVGEVTAAVAAANFIEVCPHSLWQNDGVGPPNESLLRRSRPPPGDDYILVPVDAWMKGENLSQILLRLAPAAVFVSYPAGGY